MKLEKDCPSVDDQGPSCQTRLLGLVVAADGFWQCIFALSTESIIRQNNLFQTREIMTKVYLLLAEITLSV